MILEEFLESTEPSGRLIIADASGELYRGFAGCLRYAEIDGSRNVKQHGLHTEVCRKIEHKTGKSRWMEDGERIEPERLSEFLFSDLQVKIYTKVVLEG